MAKLPNRVEQDIPDRLLRPTAVAKIFGVSLLTIYRWQDAGKLPPQVRLSDRVIGYRETEIMAMLTTARRASTIASKSAA